MRAAKELNSEVAEGLRAKMLEVFKEVLERNVHAIAHELITSADGCGGVSVKFGFQMSNGKVSVESGMSWSRKFKDEAETSFGFTDPKNPELPGVEPVLDDGREVTIKTDAGEVTTTLGAMKRAGRRVASVKPAEENN